MNQSKQPIGPRSGAYLCRAACFLLTLLAAGSSAHADSAEIIQRGNQWTLRTARMERVIALEDGRLVLKSFTDRTTGRGLVTRGTVVNAFLEPATRGAERPNVSPGGWRLLGWKQSKLPQGERQLEIAVQRDAL